MAGGKFLIYRGTQSTEIKRYGDGYLVHQCKDRKLLKRIVMYVYPVPRFLDFALNSAKKNEPENAGDGSF